MSHIIYYKSLFQYSNTKKILKKKNFNRTDQYNCKRGYYIQVVFKKWYHKIYRLIYIYFNIINQN